MPNGDRTEVYRGRKRRKKPTSQVETWLGRVAESMERAEKARKQPASASQVSEWFGRIAGEARRPPERGQPVRRRPRRRPKGEQQR